MVLRARTDTYPVRGDDLASVTASLRAGSVLRGQRRFAGYHHWNISWRIRSRYESTQCAVTMATVTIESQVVLPAWTPPPRASAELRAQWAAYLAALETHELGHRSQAVDEAVRIRETLLRVRAPRCNDIVAAARIEADRILTRLRQAGARYDAETRHGGTQGASWPPRGVVVRPATPPPKPAPR